MFSEGKRAFVIVIELLLGVSHNLHKHIICSNASFFVDLNKNCYFIATKFIQISAHSKSINGLFFKPKCYFILSRNSNKLRILIVPKSQKFLTNTNKKYAYVTTPSYVNNYYPIFKIGNSKFYVNHLMLY